VKIAGLNFVSTKGLRIIDKKGIDTVLADIRARGGKA